ncbi:MAG: hypothetical protein ABH824_06440 [Nanoarchaeota archaeon]|nr:hypothetical protein [Nanoarchaeota archaeon]MBU1632338.1 hypothetical protein [Nanoarchaeota archaeon]MBU1875770.1 hypothetical protein [Nanoarchaeota archaeon]
MRKMLVFVLIVFVCALSLPSYALSPAIQFVNIKVECGVENSLLQQNTTCLEDDCSVNVSKKYPGRLELVLPSDNYILNTEIITDEAKDFFGEKINEGILMVGRYKINSGYQEVSPYLGSICVENTDDIEPIFAEEIENWENNMEVYVYDHEMTLTFEPYSSERETELIAIKDSFEGCEYLDYKKVGNWLIVSDYTEEYCSLIGANYGKSAGFIIFVVGLLIIFVALISFLIYLWKRRELKLFFRPNKLNIIITLVLGALTSLFSLLVWHQFMALGFPSPNFTQVLFGWILSLIIGYYIFSSLLRYLYIKKKSFIFSLISGVLGILWAAYLLLRFYLELKYSGGSVIVLLMLVAWIIIASIIILVFSFWMRKPEKVLKWAILILIFGVLSFNIIAVIAGILGIMIGKKQEAVPIKNPVK